MELSTGYWVLVLGTGYWVFIFFIYMWQPATCIAQCTVVDCSRNIVIHADKGSMRLNGPQTLALDLHCSVAVNALTISLYFYHIKVLNEHMYLEAKH